MEPTIELTNESTPDSTNNINDSPVQIVMDRVEINDTISGNNFDVIVINDRDQSHNKLRAPPAITAGNENEVRVSSLYSDLIIKICGNTVTVKGCPRIEAILSCIETVRNTPTCRVCGFVSWAKVNIVAHVAYLHRP